MNDEASIFSTREWPLDGPVRFEKAVRQTRAKTGVEALAGAGQHDSPTSAARNLLPGGNPGSLTILGCGLVHYRQQSYWPFATVCNNATLAQATFNRQSQPFTISRLWRGSPQGRPSRFLQK